MYLRAFSKPRVAQERLAKGWHHHRVFSSKSLNYPPSIGLISTREMLWEKYPHEPYFSFHTRFWSTSLDAHIEHRHIPPTIRGEDKMGVDVDADLGTAPDSCAGSADHDLV